MSPCLADRLQLKIIKVGVIPEGDHDCFLFLRVRVRVRITENCDLVVVLKKMS